MQIAQSHLQSQADLSYRCELAPSEMEAAVCCLEEHGFAIVKGVLSSPQVEELKDSVRQVVNPDDRLGPGQSGTSSAFIEQSPSLARLLEDSQYLAISRQVVGASEMTVHRSAAIIRNPGAGGMAWHTDWSFSAVAGTPPLSTTDILNTGEGPSGKWFYLTGSHRQRGGIMVIPDSHTLDWEGPEGFEFTAGRSSFHRRGEAAKAHFGPDVPGAIVVETEGGDLLLFAARTYHDVLPHQGDEPRLSCGLNFRAGQTQWPTPWLLPESARRFIDSVPAAASPLVEHYTGIVPGWKPQPEVSS